LLTKNFQTTTILYYTVFLPGVFLHEFSYWLVAGMMNVRAERAIQWPETQEIAELHLTFIKLAKNIPPLKLAVITTAPLAAGLLSVWLISNSVFNISEFLATIGTGKMSDVTEGIRLIASAPDFWLWIYLLFTISNTMMPNIKDLRGWRTIIIVVVIVSLSFAILGAGNQLVVTILAGPITNALYVLASTFAIIIAIDLFVTGVLGTIEAVIERITGDSATFENGKLVAMTRQEVAELKRRQAARAIQQSKRLTSPAEAGKPSIYKFPLPIPGPPGKEAVTQSDMVIVEPEEKLPLFPSTPRDDRSGPDVITTAVTKPEKPPRPIAAPRLPAATPAFAIPKSEPEEEEETEDSEEYEETVEYDDSDEYNQTIGYDESHEYDQSTEYDESDEPDEEEEAQDDAEERA
jgi:hypothetical protein